MILGYALLHLPEFLWATFHKFKQFTSKFLIERKRKDAIAMVNDEAQPDSSGMNGQWMEISNELNVTIEKHLKSCEMRIERRLNQKFDKWMHEFEKHTKQ